MGKCQRQLRSSTRRPPSPGQPVPTFESSTVVQSTNPSLVSPYVPDHLAHSPMTLAESLLPRVARHCHPDPSRKRSSADSETERRRDKMPRPYALLSESKGDTRRLRWNKVSC